MTTEKDLKDHPAIIRLAKRRHKEQNKQSNYNRKWNPNDVFRNFHIHSTPEGYYFWNNIETGNYAMFYEIKSNGTNKRITTQHG